VDGKERSDGGGGAAEGEGDVGEGEGEGEGDPGEGEGDACSLLTQKPVAPAGGVYFGTRNPTHVQLTPAQIMAIVGVGEDGGFGADCSGTLITDDVVLTATHCTEGIAATTFVITFGVDDTRPDLVIDVVEKSEHPDLDIAMLRLASSPAAQIDVTPIPAFAGDLTSNDFGEVFEQAGFGETETQSYNGRLFVAEPFDSFEEGGFLVVNGEGRHGVCFGDSGGPSLRQLADGVRVVGALSYGDPSCTGLDRYTRVDLVRDWIVAFAGDIPGAAPVPCGSVPARGVCSADARVLTFCDNGALRHDPCTADEVCVDDDDRSRCLAVSDAPCGALTAFGVCDDAVLSWCDGDVVRVRDCAACGGQVCRRVDDAQGFACVYSQCGDLTFTGECVGDIARWCDNGVVATEDCAAEGSSCGFIDDDTGFYCR
jgi:hypothetical protein